MSKVKNPEMYNSWYTVEQAANCLVLLDKLNNCNGNCKNCNNCTVKCSGNYYCFTCSLNNPEKTGLYTDANTTSDLRKKAIETIKFELNI